MDDKAGVIKMIYTVIARKKLLVLLSTGMAPASTSNAEGQPEGDGDEISLEDLGEKVKNLVNSDAFLSEQAPDVICWKELAQPESIFAECGSVDELGKVEADIVKRVGHSKTFVAALRRIMKETYMNMFLFLFEVVLAAPNFNYCVMSR